MFAGTESFNVIFCFIYAWRRNISYERCTFRKQEKNSRIRLTNLQKRKVLFPTKPRTFCCLWLCIHIDDECVVPQTVRTNVYMRKYYYTRLGSQCCNRPTTTLMIFSMFSTNKRFFKHSFEVYASRLAIIFHITSKFHPWASFSKFQFQLFDFYKTTNAFLFLINMNSMLSLF